MAISLSGLHPCFRSRRMNLSHMYLVSDDCHTTSSKSYHTSIVGRPVNGNFLRDSRFPLVLGSSGLYVLYSDMSILVIGCIGEDERKRGPSLTGIGLVVSGSIV